MHARCARLFRVLCAVLLCPRVVRVLYCSTTHVSGVELQIPESLPEVCYHGPFVGAALPYGLSVPSHTEKCFTRVNR